MKLQKENMFAFNKVAGSTLFGLFLLVFSQLSLAGDGSTLESLEYTSLAGGQSQLQLGFSGPVPEAGSFTTNNPARLVIDLPETALAVKQTRYAYDSGAVRHIRLLEAGGRSRVVLNLVKSIPYEVRQEKNFLFVAMKSGTAQQQHAMAASATVSKQSDAERQESARSINNVDFRRGLDGEGKVLISLTDPNTVVDMQQKGQKIVVDFLATQLPERLERRLDVADFATPVTSIDTFATANGSRMVITPAGDYEHLSYQTDNLYTIDVKFIPKEELEKKKKEKFGYVGEKLSLNFQNIEVRAVLQLIADFTGLNIVASDTVQGNITLRLKNVPWDQALDIILKTRGLGIRKTGNVMLIAPNEEITAREKQELEAQKQKEELAPLRTDFFQVNYAKAEEIAALLKAKDNSLLSERGSVTIDERTNLLMVLDTADKLEEIARLVKKLDIPVRQVLIESRIVIANDDFSRDIGARFGVNTWEFGSAQNHYSSGTVEGTSEMWDSYTDNADGTFEVASPFDRLNVNLPVSNAAGQMAFAVLTGDYLVDLELSAMQKEGEGELISNPRVVTSNQKEALIEQGVEIPYLEASSSGATNVSFKKAVLSLKVTPQITPDDRVIMDLAVNKDSVGTVFNGVPSINTREVNTQVLVDSGQTVVLGGIYEQEWYDEEDKVPVLGDIPVLGVLFKQTRKKDAKKELLIFVTPKILKEGLLAHFD